MVQGFVMTSNQGFYYTLITHTAYLDLVYISQVVNGPRVCHDLKSRFLLHSYCPPLSRKRGDIKSHSSVRPSVCLSVCPSVTKTLTLAITFALLQIELWYLACVFLVTRPFRWYHVVTLTVTFDLLQGQICCRAGDHNSLNLLVTHTAYLDLAYISQVVNGPRVCHDLKSRSCLKVQVYIWYGKNICP